MFQNSKGSETGATVVSKQTTVAPVSLKIVSAKGRVHPQSLPLPFFFTQSLG